MSLLTTINPYVLYIKITAAALLVACLFFSGVWIKGVFAERAALRISEASAKATTEMYAKAYNDNQKLQEDITHAVKNIRVVSNNYIQSVEEAPAPVGPVVTLVPAGLPQAVSRLSVFGSATSSRTGAAAEAR